MIVVTQELSTSIKEMAQLGLRKLILRLLIMIWMTDFGSSVSIDQDTIAVGAYLEDSNQSTITNGSTASTDNSAWTQVQSMSIKEMAQLGLRKLILRLLIMMRVTTLVIV